MAAKPVKESENATKTESTEVPNIVEKAAPEQKAVVVETPITSQELLKK